MFIARKIENAIKFSKVKQINIQFDDREREVDVGLGQAMACMW